MARRRLHPPSRAARCGDHRGARLVVGGVGRQRGDRARARRPARHRRRLDIGGRRLARRVRRARGPHLLVPRDLRRHGIPRGRRPYARPASARPRRRLGRRSSPPSATPCATSGSYDARGRPRLRHPRDRRDRGGHGCRAEAQDRRTTASRHHRHRGGAAPVRDGTRGRARADPGRGAAAAAVLGGGRAARGGVPAGLRSDRGPVGDSRHRQFCSCWASSSSP